MSTQSRPSVAPALSLQAVQPIKRQQITLPDQRGILKPHHIHADTVKQIQDIVAAEERMETAASSMSNVPTTSLGSVASTSLVTRAVFHESLNFKRYSQNMYF